MAHLERALAPAEEVDSLVDFLKANARLERASPTALYRRLEDALRAAINEAILVPGSAIPGERELALRLGLSRVTVRKAIKALVDDRLLVQRHGARTSVVGRVEKPLSILTSFSQDMIARGFRPGGRWLKRETARALPTEALTLGLSPGSEVCRMRRLRTADDVPMAIELSVVPRAFLPNPGLVGTSLYAVLEERGYRPVRALQRLRSDIAGEEDSRLLEVSVGAPLLDVERRCFLEDGRIVEHCRSRYRGDAYDFIIELQRATSETRNGPVKTNSSRAKSPGE